MKRRAKFKKIIVAVIAMIMVSCAITAVLVYHGVILLNGFSNTKFPVRGVDVSSYQGEIDWDTLSGQNIQFAFIKATEGSSHVDPFFLHNYEEASQTDLRIGAYHFFSYDSSGGTQAENFISVVPKDKNMLPPVCNRKIL